MKLEIFGTEDESERQAVARLLKRAARARRSRAREVSVVIVDNAQIRRLNRRFLKRNRVTDVIAFPVSEKFLGEIYVSRKQAQIQARRYRVSLREELLRLILHGFLHLLGYTHGEMCHLMDDYLKAAVKNQRESVPLEQERIRGARGRGAGEQ